MRGVAQARAQGKTRYGGGWTGISSLPIDEAEDAIRKNAMSPTRGGLAHSGEPGISAARLAEIEAMAHAKETGDLSGVLNTPDRNAQGGFPAQYSWTSFSGMAEQMQMMWSGAPALDAAQSTADNTAQMKQDISTLVAFVTGGGGPGATGQQLFNRGIDVANTA
jgi:hypothetical protein